MERSGQGYYLHTDGLGSIASITDSGHNVVQSYVYDSFGMATPSTGFRNSFTYTGREWDKETGLYYYRARYYDPMEGRFISKDPIGFKGGVNHYSYVQENPVNFTDPYGLKPFGRTYCEDVTVAFGFCADTVSLGAMLAGHPEISLVATVASGINSSITYTFCGKNPKDVRSAVTSALSVITYKAKAIYSIVIGLLSVVEDFDNFNPKY